VPDAGPGGRFIVFEGPDGAGKSVQARTLAERLDARGYRVTYSREPGGTQLGEQVRQILLDPADVARGPVADALLFNAARSQLIADVIRPSLERGGIVVLDRYATSTMAYQGYGSGVDRAALAAIASLATGDLMPDLILLIDVPVEVGLARRDAGRAEDLTRFEDASRHDGAFHERVRAGYLEMAAADPARWVVLDGDASPISVAKQVDGAVDDLLRRASKGGRQDEE
jgi:dTMP kinase